jgi:hypothetical protein
MLLLLYSQRNNLGTQWMRGWVGPRSGLDAVEKSFALAGNPIPVFELIVCFVVVTRDGSYIG